MNAAGDLIPAQWAGSLVQDDNNNKEKASQEISGKNNTAHLAGANGFLP